MIEHVVLFRVAEGTPEEQTEAMMRGLKSLETEIPQVVSLSCGPNISDRGDGFTHGLVVRFESPEALEIYLEHPRHQQTVQEFVLPIAERIVICDYVVETTDS